MLTNLDFLEKHPKQASSFGDLEALKTEQRLNKFQD